MGVQWRWSAEEGGPGRGGGRDGEREKGEGGGRREVELIWEEGGVMLTSYPGWSPREQRSSDPNTDQRESPPFFHDTAITMPSGSLHSIHCTSPNNIPVSIIRNTIMN